MPRIILNRDLQPQDVPVVPVRQLECGDENGHPAAWAIVWRFGQTFDTLKYCQATGTDLSLETLKGLTARWLAEVQQGKPVTGEFFELRAVLAHIYDWYGSGPTAEVASLIDEVLDAIYRDLSGGGERPRGDTGPYEPALGHRGESPTTDKLRFWFISRDGLDRLALFDRVAGKLLRERPDDVLVSALYLYPPRYYPDASKPPLQVFILLLQPRGTYDRDLGDTEHTDLGRVADRLARSVIADVADPTYERWPSSEARPLGGDLRGG
jgi:hypothetical protein